jgi:hypothetical protein
MSDWPINDSLRSREISRNLSLSSLDVIQFKHLIKNRKHFTYQDSMTLKNINQCRKCISYNIVHYYMDNSVLPETKTLVFSIFSLVKIWKSYVPNVPYLRACPKNIFPPVCCRLFLQKMATPRVFVEVSDDDLVKFPVKHYYPYNKKRYL